MVSTQAAKPGGVLCQRVRSFPEGATLRVDGDQSFGIGCRWQVSTH
jgi:hypothetical protein